MALDRSPESFSPQMNSTSLFLWFQLVTLGVGPVLIPRHHMIKIDKGLQGYATYQKSKALSLQVSEKKNFEVGLLCSYVPTCNLVVGSVLTPKESYE